MGRSGGTSRKREELANFLRTRRSRLRPSDCGLSASPGRRRTPGLRREEVAVLAGIGTSWYTWLEQGRDINVSESVARAIGSALRLSPSEIRYLYQLLDINPPPYLRDAADPRALDLGSIVDEWMPSPALVIDSLWNLLAYNTSAAVVFGIVESEPNLLVSFFTNPAVRARYVDPLRTGRLAVAQFRTGAAARYDDPEFVRLVNGLRERSPEFAALWHSHEVVDACLKVKELDHPEVGSLCFDTQSWQLDGPDIRLFLHLPRRQSDTRAKLAHLLRVREPALVAGV
ncbi:helix-turn-helix transcriptional regulator [Actinokineospora sp. UTMC 2448]|uniref:helix-turn-helix transcriptional regulator n=1 Tax=Actinokineospora sp. UTMC 2448 TaxID=2268449 RepID=UPI0021644E1F|nr:helix-turn-helix transcriptional regulator [Actinokineospora sp. UTMC 2448]